MRRIIIIAHNIRSVHNIGSLFRTAEGLGVEKLVLSGYSPHPSYADDTRLPHEAQKITRQLTKTALGAEQTLAWEYVADVKDAVTALRKDGFTIAALEQTANAIKLPDFRPPAKLVLILGREVEGIEPEVLQLCDLSVEIPMLGSKESFNVVQAAAMALYHCRFYS